MQLRQPEPDPADAVSLRDAVTRALRQRRGTASAPGHCNVTVDLLPDPITGQMIRQGLHCGALRIAGRRSIDARGT